MRARTRAGAGIGVALAGALLLAGCGDDTAEPPSATVAPSPAAAPLSYDYLTKLPLDVSDVVVNDSWMPAPGNGEHVENLATHRPVEALARMVHDRLVASGGQGRAVVTIEDASLVRSPGQLVGTFSVQIAFDGVPGETPPPVTAAVSGTRTLSSDASEAATADTLMGQLMDQMNVELEYQIRHQLADRMTGNASPVPEAVQSQSLAPPPGASAAPVPAATPPMANPPVANPPAEIPSIDVPAGPAPSP